MRVIGMDIHRSFAQVAILEDGEIKKELRVDLVHDRLVSFAKTLSLEDEVVIEATGNSAAPGIWMAFGGACGLVATLLIYRARTVQAAPAGGSPA